MRKTANEKLMWRLSIISIIAFAVIVFAFFIFGLYKINVIELPDFIVNIFGGGSDSPTEVIPGDEGAIMDAIKEHGTGAEVVLLPDVEKVDLVAVLYETPECSVYTMTSHTTLKSEDSELTTTNLIWRSGDKYRIETYGSDGVQLLSTVICDGEQVSVTDNIYGSTAKYPASPEFSVSSQAGMPDITLTRGEGAPEIAVSLVRTQDDNLYYVVYDDPELGQHEELYISIEYGIVMRAESKVGDETVYTLETESFAAVNRIPTSKFRIN